MEDSDFSKQNLYCPFRHVNMFNCFGDKCMLWYPYKEYSKKSKGVCAFNMLAKEIYRLRKVVTDAVNTNKEKKY